MAEYTWEDVSLGIDVRNEVTAKQKKDKEIRDMQAKEATAASGWSLGLSILGAALFGPIGYFAGKQIGSYGADLYYDWESMEIDPGKFYKEEVKVVNEMLEKEAKDQTGAQIINTITDLASMYVQAGGLQEGPTDITTFGSGEDEWRVFQRGEAGTPASADFIEALPAQKIPGPVPGSYEWLPQVTGQGTAAVPASADYVSGLWQPGGGFFKNLANVGMSVGGVYAAGQLSDLGRMGLEYYTKDEVKEDNR